MKQKPDEDEAKASVCVMSEADQLEKFLNVLKTLRGYKPLGDGPNEWELLDGEST